MTRNLVLEVGFALVLMRNSRYTTAVNVQKMSRMDRSFLPIFKSNTGNNLSYFQEDWSPKFLFKMFARMYDFFSVKNFGPNCLRRLKISFFFLIDQKF